MKAIQYLIVLLLLIPGIPIRILSQQGQTSSSDNKGIERIQRKEGQWNWGTCGHGSFEDAVKLFNAQKEIATYTDGRATYRVFTRGNKNYIEMNSGWYGGIFTYTTNADQLYQQPQLPLTTVSQQVPVSSELMSKITRKEGNWYWGTCGHGDFDEAARVLVEQNNIIRFSDPVDPRIKYRIFTHTTFNFVEIDYGWSGGVFCYVIKK